jgi:hypothetical protein
MMTRRALLYIAVLCVLAPLGWSFDLGTGRGTAMGGNTIMSHATPLELLANPTGITLDRSWRVETGFVRTFDLKELDEGLAAASIRRGAVTVAIGISQLGQRDFYAEQTAKGAVVYSYKSFSAGATLSALRYSFGGAYTPVSAVGIGTGCGWHHKQWYVSVSADNLNQPKLYPEAVPFEPTGTLQAEFVTHRQLSTLGRIMGQKNEPPRFGLGQRIGIGERNALMWGLSTAPMLYGGGVEFWFGRIGLTFSASYHPTLGMSEMLNISVGSRESGSKGLLNVLNR